MSFHKKLVNWLNRKIPDSVINHYTRRGKKQIRITVPDEGGYIVPDLIEGGNIFHEVEARDIDKNRYALLDNPNCLWIAITGTEYFDDVKLLFFQGDAEEPCLMLDMDENESYNEVFNLMERKQEIKNEIDERRTELERKLDNRKAELEEEIKTMEKTIEEYRNEIEDLKNEIVELTSYLDSYDLKALRNMRKKERALEASIESLMEQAWVIEGIKQLKISEINADKDCAKCPFFRSWLKKAYKKEFGIDPYMEIKEDVMTE